MLHKRSITTADSNTSAVAEHALMKKSQHDWNGAKVIDGSDKLDHIESWQIRKNMCGMNKESGILPTGTIAYSKARLKTIIKTMFITPPCNHPKDLKFVFYYLIIFCVTITDMASVKKLKR